MRTGKSPLTFWRNYHLPAKLDLWLIRFSERTGESRGQIQRDALYRFLRQMDAENEPVGTAEEILKERWGKRHLPGRRWLTYENSQNAIRARTDPEVRLEY
jgi:hypothetical protein